MVSELLSAIHGVDAGVALAQTPAHLNDELIGVGGLRDVAHAEPLPLWIHSGIHTHGRGFGGLGASLSNSYMRCSMKACWLIPLGSIGEAVHHAMRANLHIDALTMFEHAWQSIAGCCALCIFRIFSITSSDI